MKMKRAAEGDVSAPRIKRLNSNSSAQSNSIVDDEEDDDPRYFFLRNQNKALSGDVFRCKSQISESRKELELMRNKSREMETLVGVIQRAWSQVSKEMKCVTDFTFIIMLEMEERKCRFLCFYDTILYFLSFSNQCTN